MDSARDFDLLGESVPQVQVSARTLALLGFFQHFIYTDLACGLKGTVWDGDLVTVLDWRGPSTTRL